MDYKELEQVCTDATQWVKNNLNPHQQLIITLDGIKVVSDELFIPSSTPIIYNKKNDRYVQILDEGGRYRGYVEFYNFMKKKHPDLPPFSGYIDITGEVLRVVDCQPHLSYRDTKVLVLTDGKYTYLVTEHSRYVKEVTI